uniref:BZIP domain-containing protein n=1 Tax=Pundamilia nyererei TaxID=303518 RepID=A0A3B4FAF8_9CICH
MKNFRGFYFLLVSATTTLYSKVNPDNLMAPNPSCFPLFFEQDDKYWARRRKNNLAAKRSRDARRLKENQIAIRASFLEKENSALRQEVADLRKELGRTKNILAKYEPVTQNSYTHTPVGACLQPCELFSWTPLTLT